MKKLNLSKKACFKLLGVAGFLALTVPNLARACSAFRLMVDDKVVVGKSYDWLLGHGHGAVFTNLRGISKTALNLNDSPNPAHWVSKYGSVTLTQFGKGFPISGINEKGLVVEMLQLKETRYNSEQDELPFVNEAQWSQFQLDNFASVDEVLANVDKLRVVQAFTGIHYFITDTSGKSTVIDFVRHKPVVHVGVTLPVPGITNDTYLHSIMLRNGALWANRWILSEVRTSGMRFLTVADRIEESKSVPKEQLVDYAFQTLEKVQQNGISTSTPLVHSQWNIVYDLREGVIRFRTHKADQIKVLRMDGLDFSPAAVSKTFDMNTSNIEGDITTKLADFTPEFNRQLIDKNWLLLGKKLRTQVIRYGLSEAGCELPLD